mgnify:CR=1 FL=1
MKKSVVFAAAALALAMGSAQAAAPEFTAYTPTMTVGNQSFSGALGMDFNVNSSILVTQVGAFDSGGDGFQGPVQVGIFNRDTQTLVAGSFAALSGMNETMEATTNVRFANVTDFTLAAGHYSIVAVGYSATEPNGNSYGTGLASTTNTGGGAISFVGTSRYTGTTSLVFPTTTDNSVARYSAGSFKFQAAPVPEPETYALMLAGLGALGFMGRRRKGASKA